MADKEVLSQEEIDALLTVVDAEEKEDASAETVSATDNTKSTEYTTVVHQAGENSGEPEIRVVNFLHQERIVRGELPVFSNIHDRMVRLFTNDVYQYIGKDLIFEQEHLKIIKHNEFIASLPNPTLTTIFRFMPLRGKIAIMYDVPFVFNIVDHFFGGTSQFSTAKDITDFTLTELRVMDNLTKKIVRNEEIAWAPIVKIEAVKVSEEMNPHMVHFCEPNELLLVSRFVVDFGKEKGSFSVIFPYSSIEPIKQRLEIGASRPDDELDPNWINSLREEVMYVELAVNASMVGTMSSLGKIKKWQVGDFIPLAMEDVLTIDIEGKPAYFGALGQLNDMRAVKITGKHDND